MEQKTPVNISSQQWYDSVVYQLTWTRHWMTSSSWTSSPETFFSHHCDSAAPAGTSSGALWLGPASAAPGEGHDNKYFYLSLRDTANTVMFCSTMSMWGKTHTYLLLPQLFVRTCTMCEESDAGHGCTHVILWSGQTTITIFTSV